MATYGRPVSESEIRAAEGAAWMRRPDNINGLIKARGGLNSDAGNELAWKYRREEEKAGLIPGVAGMQANTVRQNGTDGIARDFTRPAPTPDELGNRTIAQMYQSGQLAQATAPQPQQARSIAGQHAQSGQARIDAQTPLYRGMAGVGLGSVNGKEELYPVAGHVGEYSAAMGAVGLSGQTGASRQAYEQGRSNLVRGQEAGRRQAKKDASAAGDLAFERQKELAGIKSYRGGGVGKSGDTVTEREQKAGIGAYNKAVVDWRKNLTDGNTLAEMVARARMNQETIIKYKGTEYDIEQADAMADAWTTATKPSTDDYYVKPGPAAKPGGPVNAPQPGILDRIGGMFRGGGQPAPAAQPTGAPPQNRQHARNAYISSLDPSLWESLDHNEREQFLASQGL